MRFVDMTVLLTVLFLATLLESRSVGDDSEVDQAAIKYFDRYLSECSESEIRCVWFLNDTVQIGMVMTIDLSKYNVHTVRDVYAHAHQSSRTRELSHSQILTLKGLMAAMPKSNAEGNRFKSVRIAFWREGKVEVREYSRAKLPRAAERIYDIGGGYVAGDAHYFGQECPLSIQSEGFKMSIAARGLEPPRP